jgi:hypothetical protein
MERSTGLARLRFEILPEYHQERFPFFAKQRQNHFGQRIDEVLLLKGVG